MSAGRDVVSQFRQCNPTIFEDNPNAFGATYASVRITPLNQILRKRSHIFMSDFVRQTILGRSSALRDDPCQRSLGAVSSADGGALVSTHRWKRRRHVEDGSLASLKTEPKQINADHQDLALAA